MPKRFKKENFTGDNKNQGSGKGSSRNIGKKKEDSFPRKYQDKDQSSQRKEKYPRKQEAAPTFRTNHDKALPSAPIESPLQKEGAQDDLIRLNRYIANAGVCSRRGADNLIARGDITVNDKVITALGHKVNRSDSVKYKGKVLKREKLVYVLLNKPKGFITTTQDPDDRKTVMNLVASACEERIYPVGRLDRNTTGLLLLTNDGDLTKKLSHPSHKVKKLYQVDVDKPVSDEDFLKIQAGIALEDGVAEVDELAFVTPDNKSLGIEIHIGRNRIVRRIFESLGYEVVKLDRVMYAGLTKLDLPRGQWRYLSEKEVIKLKYLK